MSVTPHSYSKAGLSLATKLVDLTSDTIKVMLLSAYTIGTTLNDAQFVADVLAAPATQCSGPGYTAGGLALATPTFTQSGAVWALTGDDLTWHGDNSWSAAFALVYDSTPGTDATNPVLQLFDLGGSASVGDPFTLGINVAGLFTLTPNP
jgi:hypothetical protein